MVDFTAFRHPVLAVACPACGAAPGACCRVPGEPRPAFPHRSRIIAADRAFFDQHGPDAAMIQDAGRWHIDRRGQLRD